jgi:hypothetical protein
MPSFFDLCIGSDICNYLGGLQTFVPAMKKVFYVQKKKILFILGLLRPKHSQTIHLQGVQKACLPKSSSTYHWHYDTRAGELRRSLSA